VERTRRTGGNLDLAVNARLWCGRYPSPMNADSIVDAMYASMSFERGERPDWQLQSEVFADNARLVRVNDDGVFEFDPASFRRNFEAMIDSGSIPSFWEGELWRQTLEFGDVAHVLSAYEMRTCREGQLIASAVKSIQLYRNQGKWRISAMLWRREGKEIVVPRTAPRVRFFESAR
jgi:hypothetical protein